MKLQCPGCPKELDVPVHFTTRRTGDGLALQARIDEGFLRAHFLTHYTHPGRPVPVQWPLAA